MAYINAGVDKSPVDSQEALKDWLENSGVFPQRSESLKEDTPFVLDAVFTPSLDGSKPGFVLVIVTRKMVQRLVKMDKMFFDATHGIAYLQRGLEECPLQVVSAGDYASKGHQVAMCVTSSSDHLRHLAIFRILWTEAQRYPGVSRLFTTAMADQGKGGRKAVKLFLTDMRKV